MGNRKSELMLMRRVTASV